MFRIRCNAATGLLENEYNADVDSVLDFFEGLAGIFLKPHGWGPFRTSVLPDKWARHTFYSSSIVVSMPSDRPDWRNDIDLKLFFRLPDGHFGRMAFSIIAGGQHFCMLDSLLNPTGSRNLEQQ